MRRNMQWIPAALAAAVLLSGCSRRDDLPSEAESEDRTTNVTSVTETTALTEDTNGVLDDAGTMLSEAVEDGRDIVSDVIDGGETLVSDTSMSGGTDSTGSSTATETSR